MKNYLFFRFRAISQERIVEKFPCEYCEESFAADLLALHEVILNKDIYSPIILFSIELNR